MKVFVFFLLVAAAAAFPAPGSGVGGILRTARAAVVTKAYFYASLLFQRNGPYSFPTLPGQQLVETGLNVWFSTSNVKLIKVEDITVEEMSVGLSHLTFSVALNALLQGEYVLSGTAFQTTVQKSGTFSVNIEKFVLTGVVNMAIVDRSLQIQDLTLDYSIAGAKFDVEELVIQGLVKEKVEDFLNEGLLAFVQQNRVEVAQKVAAQTMTTINQRLKLAKNWLTERVVSMLPFLYAPS